MVTKMEIACYGEHNKFRIGSGDFEAVMSKLRSFGLQLRIMSASIVVVPHHTGLIAQSWMKIHGNTISSGNVYWHRHTSITQERINKYIVSNYIVSNYTVSNYIVSNYIVSNYILSNYIVSNYIVTNYIVFGNIIFPISSYFQISSKNTSIQFRCNNCRHKWLLN